MLLTVKQTLVVSSDELVIEAFGEPGQL